MKKIDLHLHTVATPSDSKFEFSIDTLEKYVHNASLDCIAITNHNIFDKAQYLIIKDRIDAVVLPGIEVDIEGGHILVISDQDNVESFEKKCALVNADIPDAKSEITFERFHEIFGDLSQYILIPHIDKSPSLGKPTLEKFKDYIDCGEVQSVKKFLYALNKGSQYPPVLFSDMRAKIGLEKFPIRQTYIDTGDLTFASLKQCLRNRDKLFLTETEGNSFFTVLSNGLEISTGLNVILGQRSSGKSFTLDRIVESSEYEEIKYIQQFELLEKSESEDEGKFEERIKTRRKSYIEQYLKEFKTVLEDVEDVDLEYSEKTVEQYLDTLKNFAFNKNRHDTYSSTALFSEQPYKPTNLKTLQNLISSTQDLLDNKSYKHLIEKNISRVALINLLKDLVQEYRTELLVNKQKLLVNSIVKDIQAQLNVQSATTPISDTDLYQVALDKMKVKKFESIAAGLKHQHDETIETYYGFSVVARKSKFKGAGELKATSKTKYSFSELYKLYDQPYKYLKHLRAMEVIASTEFYKFFCNIRYEVLNADGFKVSGGERSEFRLLQNIKDAHKYDILLIDEPESSFDNVFLLTKVNKLIKDLSKNMPVIVVTHNSTVGASINPDYLLYTKKDIVDGQVSYDIYFGHPNDRDLKSLDGKSHPNYSVQINCLEAGAAPYEERGKSYEVLKN
ncbi:histidinol phosphatase [Thalassotalea euphylliae]|uniref:histidinol phosphatase n=1 Tax=Thalassotalea euphylliae TaxID=1655234 RepID=UPI00363691DA